MNSPEYIEYTQDDSTISKIPIRDEESLEDVRKEAFFTVEN